MTGSCGTHVGTLRIDAQAFISHVLGYALLLGRTELVTKMGRQLVPPGVTLLRVGDRRQALANLNIGKVRHQIRSLLQCPIRQEIWELQAAPCTGITADGLMRKPLWLLVHPLTWGRTWWCACLASLKLQQPAYGDKLAINWPYTVFIYN